jgi:alanine racemase
MPVGIIAFGYGDGYPLTARDGTPILIKGVECPLIGRVYMDMITVDLRPCSTAQIGDTATLWGEGLPIERVSGHTANSTWNILAGIQHRVKFFWTAL